MQPRQVEVPPATNGVCVSDPGSESHSRLWSPAVLWETETVKVIRMEQLLLMKERHRAAIRTQHLHLVKADMRTGEGAGATCPVATGLRVTGMRVG